MSKCTRHFEICLLEYKSIAISAFLPNATRKILQKPLDRSSNIPNILSNQINSNQSTAIYHTQEVLGLTQLGKLAETIFGDEDPTQVFYRGLIQEIIQQNDRYILRLPLPHVEMDKVLMTKKGDEVTIEIGNFKRDITLPTVLVNQEATVAKFVNKALEIHFSAPMQRGDKSA